ncbi:hypothetical protein CIB84_008499 [Bambusicola thoracicus]|uniref:G-protein coupled receptors family 2 profile 2 domain-containing protein n=1 Tax=Bambusicola thoracicus TaxID=9083 RepID=A0A2P4SUH4_BAMTH|nr:hypothetical protein CIB84_008499 [Bambusicola thoracicus]
MGAPRCPPQINLLIFMRILKVILAKLRANQKGYADYKLRLAKATLTLIPLFGIHEVVFIFATDEQTTGILRYIKVFFTLFLNSFQGFLVAVLYCFANKEGHICFATTVSAGVLAPADLTTGVCCL